MITVEFTNAEARALWDLIRKAVPGGTSDRHLDGAIKKVYSAADPDRPGQKASPAR